MGFPLLAGFSWIQGAMSILLVGVVSFLMRATEANPAPMIVSILIFFFADAHLAITVANACICAATFPAFVLDAFRHKKYDPRLSLLQWDLLILFRSFSLLGAIVGAIGNTVFPSWALNTLIGLFLIFVIGKRIFYLFLVKSTIEEDRALLRQDQLSMSQRIMFYDTMARSTRHPNKHQEVTPGNKIRRHTLQAESNPAGDNASQRTRFYAYTFGTTEAQLTDTVGDSTIGDGPAKSSLALNDSAEHSKLVEQLLEGHSVSAYESICFDFTSSSDESSSDPIATQNTAWPKKVARTGADKEHKHKSAVVSTFARAKNKGVPKAPLYPSHTESRGKKYATIPSQVKADSKVHNDEHNSESEIKEVVVQIGPDQDIELNNPLEVMCGDHEAANSKNSFSPELSEVRNRSSNLINNTGLKPMDYPEQTPHEKEQNVYVATNPLNDIPKAISLEGSKSVHGLGVTHFKGVDPLRTILFLVFETLILTILGVTAYYGRSGGEACNWLLIPLLVAAGTLSIVQAALHMEILRRRISAFYTLVNESLLTTSTDEHILKYKLTCGTLQPAPLVNINSHIKIAACSFFSGVSTSLIGYGGDLIIAGLFDKLQMHRRTHVSLQFAQVFFVSLYASLMEVTFETMCLPSSWLYILMTLIASMAGYALCDRIMEKFNSVRTYFLHIFYIVLYIIVFLVSVAYLIVFLISAISEKYVRGLEPLCLTSREYCPLT